MARNRYEQLIERIFLAHYKRGSTEVTFERDEIPPMAKRLGIEIPKNLGDLIIAFDTASHYRVRSLTRLLKASNGSFAQSGAANINLS